MLLLLLAVDQQLRDAGSARVSFVPDCGSGGEQGSALISIEAGGQGVLLDVDGSRAGLGGAEGGAFALVHAGEEGDLALGDVGKRKSTQRDLLPVAVLLLDAGLGPVVAHSRVQLNLEVVTKVFVQLLKITTAEVLARGSARTKEVRQSRESVLGHRSSTGRHRDHR